MNPDHAPGSALLQPAWWAEQVKNLHQPSRMPRRVLQLHGQNIGSVAEPAFSQFVHRAQVDKWLQHDQAADAWQIMGDPDRAVDVVARAMREWRYARVDELWRDELLAIRDARGAELLRVERGAVRALGLRTQAVHLHGLTPDGRIWLQQRSTQKATDPGLWDTLMGGMVSAQDNLTQALRRETWEEAGLPLACLRRLHAGGYFVQQRPHAMDGGLGYLVERIDWFVAEVPADRPPRNIDGEVARFAALAPIELVPLLHSGQVTPESSIILAQAVFGLQLPAQP
ncbi:MAG: hypothetical protein Fur007_24110 [Rhodoferax sp.]